MAFREEDRIDFGKLEQELEIAIEADAKYQRENDAKFRAIDQKVACYEDFRQIVLASNLKPLDKGEKLFENEHFQQPWNIHAGKRESATQEQASSGTLKDPRRIPKNGHEFTQDWRRHCKTTEQRYKFLVQLGPEAIQQIFKTEISFGLLGELIEALSIHDESDTCLVLDIMEVLSRAGRFGLSLQFLSSKEKEKCKEMFVKIDNYVTREKIDEMYIIKVEHLKDVFEVS